MNLERIAKPHVRKIERENGIEMTDKVKFNDIVMNLDYLIFSAHKTATQTMVQTLRRNGYNSVSCHILGNKPVSMKRGNFEAYTNEYLLKHNKKLKILSVFREPIERHISSFFEWYGTKPLRDKDVNSRFDTIIYKKTIVELQRQLLEEIENKTLVGQVESIQEICNELKIEFGDLSFEIEKGYGFYETETAKIYLSRFDILIQNLSEILTSVTGKKIRQFDSNKSDSKWYRGIYSEFKDSIKIPHEIINGVYSPRRELIEIFYKEGFQSALEAAIYKYSKA